MNILIVGSDLNAILLAQYLNQTSRYNDVYVTTNEKYDGCNYIPIDIKEGNIMAICDFVKYNQIEFTVVTSPIAIINGIADELTKEGFPVFAPFSEAARITYLNSVAKKIMYKLKINTPKFGIFDRENLAIDYVRNAKYPLVIQDDLALIRKKSEFYSGFLKAKNGIQKKFESSNDKIIIENYIDEEPIYMYFITDGYNAQPLIILEKQEEGKYQKITAPSEKISEENIIDILNNVIYPLIDDIKQYAGKYVGILGLKIKLHNNNCWVLEFYNEFQGYDFQAFLSLIDGNYVDTMKKTVDGKLNETYIDITDEYSFTLAINKNEINKKETDEDDDYTESQDENRYIFTSTSRTLNQARKKLYSQLENIINEEILNEIIENDKQKEKRI